MNSDKNLINRLTIRALIEGSFFFATFTILIMITIAAFYFNERSLQEKHESNLQKTHELLSHLIIPVLRISDVAEIRRLLQLASSPGETFVVVDSSSSILMSDYTKINLIKSVILPKHAEMDCQNLHTVYKYIDKNGYWVNCNILKNDDIVSHDKSFGILISFSKYKWLYFSPMMLYFVGITLLTLVLIVIWFRQILYRRLLKPLIILGHHIVDISKSPLTADSCINDIGNAPYEVFAIKQAFETLLINLQAEYKQRTESEKKAVLLDLAAQVAHDIRSPLAVMEMTLADSVKYISQESASIQKEAIQSVRNIANNLLSRYREPNVAISVNFKPDGLICADSTLVRPLFLYLIVEQLVSQKRHEWQHSSVEVNLIIDSNSKFACIESSPNEIKSTLSNLLNNAFESLTENRKIKVHLSLNNNYLQLCIFDTGQGIPQDKIAAVLSGTSLKHIGKGLGLSSAKRFIENINGKLELYSCEGEGSKVMLYFPCSLKPAWLPAVIGLTTSAPIIVLDDDASIHSVWRQRLQSNKLNLLHFSSSDELVEWYDNNAKLRKEAVYLLDYELRGDHRTGLDLLKYLNVKQQSYLVTSHADEFEIQEAVTALNSWLIHKSLLADIPLRIG